MHQPERQLQPEQFERHRAQLRGGRLSDAGLASARPRMRCRRRGSGSSRSRETSIDNLGGWLTTVVGRVCIDMLRARKARREDARRRGCPSRSSAPRRRPRARDAARRLGRPRPAGGPRHADPGRAPGVRAPRHVRGAVRRHRPDCRPLARRRPSAGQPRAPPRARRACRRPTPTSPASARSSPLSWQPRARELRRAARAARPGVVMRLDRARRLAAARPARPMSRAPATAGPRFARPCRPALVNGTAGILVESPTARIAAVAFTITDGLIATIDIVRERPRSGEPRSDGVHITSNPRPNREPYVLSTVCVLGTGKPPLAQLDLSCYARPRRPVIRLPLAR